MERGSRWRRGAGLTESRWWRDRRCHQQSFGSGWRPCGERAEGARRRGRRIEGTPSAAAAAAADVVAEYATSRRSTNSHAAVARAACSRDTLVSASRRYRQLLKDQAVQRNEWRSAPLPVVLVAQECEVLWCRCRRAAVRCDGASPASPLGGRSTKRVLLQQQRAVCGPMCVDEHSAAV